MRPEVCVLLESYAALYVEVPKVACTSLKVALAGLLGIDLALSDGNSHEAPFPSAVSREQVAPGRVDYRGTYTTSSRRAVARRFQEDIELFKYQFEF